MKRLLLLLSILTLSLVSCNRGEAILPTTPSDSSSITISASPSVTPSVTTESPSPATTTTVSQWLDETSRLPVTTSKPDPGSIAIDGWGKNAFILAHIHWEDPLLCGCVVDEGDPLELKLRVGHPLSEYGVDMYVKDTSVPMELVFTFDGEGELLPGNKYVIEDFWTNPIYMLHPHETRPFEVAQEISVVIDTSALTCESGEIRFMYEAEGHTSGMIVIEYEKRDGKIIVSHSARDNAIDLIYDRYLG